MPDENAAIANAESQHKESLGKLLGSSGSHDQLAKAEHEASQQREMADAQDSLRVAQENKKE